KGSSRTWPAWPTPGTSRGSPIASPGALLMESPANWQSGSSRPPPAESDAGPQPRGGDLTGLGRAPHGADADTTEFAMLIMYECDGCGIRAEPGGREPGRGGAG